MPLACAALAFSASAAGPELATITGRVFDVYHRPVRSARVAPIERRNVNGKVRLVPGATQAIVDAAGMYRLSLPPGRYLLAVLPPPAPLDFATVFPAYLNDTVDAEKAPMVEIHPGELRPFVDFLLLEVESHRLSGEIGGISPPGASVAISLYASSGYTEPLQTVLADTHSRFLFDRVPAGSYELKAAGPVSTLNGLKPHLGASPKYGAIHVDVRAPEISGLRIHLQGGPR